MSSTVERDEVTVTLETPDGMAWTGKALVVTVEVGGGRLLRMADDAYIDLFSKEWRMELIGMGELSFLEREQFVRRVKEERGADTWRCLYCGALMHSVDLKCSGCGGWRSAIYEL